MNKKDLRLRDRASKPIGPHYIGIDLVESEPFDASGNLAVWYRLPDIMGGGNLVGWAYALPKPPALSFYENWHDASAAYRIAVLDGEDVESKALMREW